MERLKSEVEAGLLRFIENARKECVGKLAGVALCTDDTLSTLGAVACDSTWIEHGPEEVDRWVPTEWPYYEAHDELAMGRVALLSEASAAGDFEQFVGTAFGALVASLKLLRDTGAVENDVLLVLLSTDPGPRLEELALRCVDELNSESLALTWRRAMGF